MYPYPTTWQSRPPSPGPLPHHHHHHHHPHPHPHPHAHPHAHQHPHPQAHHHHHIHGSHAEPLPQGPRRTQVLQKINTAQHIPINSVGQTHRLPEFERRNSDLSQASSSIYETRPNGRAAPRPSKTSRDAYPVARDAPNGGFSHQTNISSRQTSYA
ncbi:hypothetical protein BJ508DRAFT_35939 [Ascobolus immersus RN42]|uniref:Uncharacterized protein n=1 Tax=Ascobolus immersus RN42 TaxID=1160509 RepID=A0A3N4HM53_ASCIM|nr:hypothetical protein BJ508DRAFT_35939 [Ascobolus immersus RN42]